MTKHVMGKSLVVLMNIRNVASGFVIILVMSCSFVGNKPACIWWASMMKALLTKQHKWIKVLIYDCIYLSRGAHI
jgi:hypothetical protein